MTTAPDRSQQSASLRDRLRIQTRDEIYRTAIDLFVANGYEATTMDEIADAAGVSRRTVYRYFPLKEDVLFEGPRRWLEVFSSTVATRRCDESLFDAVRRAGIAVAEHLAQDPVHVQAGRRVSKESSALRSRAGLATAEWTDAITRLLAAERDADPRTDLAAAVGAGALVHGIGAVGRVWAAGGGDVVAMTRQMHDLVEPMWQRALAAPIPPHTVQPDAKEVTP
ncbi:TetR/AcrR family transcriptional regulator [Mycobacterium spongiae]|uniref:TetR/AcrR family transcriptional regulator n=1 Tax=Mycobacterium spongiae TaxID=886343 RepID=UPI001BAB85F9|nr:TetR family transcriptional regulator [Mycobacterium spongiae]